MSSSKKRERDDQEKLDNHDKQMSNKEMFELLLNDENRILTRVSKKSIRDEFKRGELRDKNTPKYKTWIRLCSKDDADIIFEFSENKGVTQRLYGRQMKAAQQSDEYTIQIKDIEVDYKEKTDEHRWKKFVVIGGRSKYKINVKNGKYVVDSDPSKKSKEEEDDNEEDDEEEEDDDEEEEEEYEEDELSDAPVKRRIVESDDPLQNIFKQVKEGMKFEEFKALIEREQDIYALKVCERNDPTISQKINEEKNVLIAKYEAELITVAKDVRSQLRESLRPQIEKELRDNWEKQMVEKKEYRGFYDTQLNLIKASIRQKIEQTESEKLREEARAELKAKYLTPEKIKHLEGVFEDNLEAKVYNDLQDSIKKKLIATQSEQIEERAKQELIREAKMKQNRSLTQTPSPFKVPLSMEEVKNNYLKTVQGYVPPPNK